MSDTIFGSSNRVVIRPVEKSDMPLLYKWINDPKVTQFLGARYPMTEHDEEKWYEDLSKRKEHNVVFAIVDRENDKPIGSMGVHNIDYVNGTATTGALIGEKEYWGKGFGGEAKMLVLNYAFNKLNLYKIYSDVIAYNERSVKYSLKCGYEVEAVFKNHFLRFGRRWDEVILSIYREQFDPLWEKFCAEHGIKQYPDLSGE